VGASEWVTSTDLPDSAPAPPSRSTAAAAGLPLTAREPIARVLVPPFAGRDHQLLGADLAAAASTDALALGTGACRRGFGLRRWGRRRFVLGSSATGSPNTWVLETLGREALRPRLHLSAPRRLVLRTHGYSKHRGCFHCRRPSARLPYRSSRAAPKAIVSFPSILLFPLFLIPGFCSTPHPGILLHPSVTLHLTSPSAAPAPLT